MTDGTSVTKAELAMRGAIERLTRERVSAAELERARNLAYIDLVHELATIEGRADLFGSYEVLFGDHAAAFRLEQRLAAVDAESLQSLVQSFCRDDNLTVATLLPADAEMSAATPADEGDGDESDAEGDKDGKQRAGDKGEGGDR